MKVDELRAMSIGEIEDYLNALLDLPRPANDEARANWRRALHALRDKYDEEHTAALGVSVAEYRALSDAIVAGVPSSIHAQIMAMMPRDLQQFLQQFLREIEAELDGEDDA